MDALKRRTSSSSSSSNDGPAATKRRTDEISRGAPAHSLRRDNRWTGARVVVAQVAAALSDVHLVYGGGEITRDVLLATDGRTVSATPNALGRVTSVVPLVTRDTAGATLLGVAQAGAVGAATTAGPAFLPLLPALRRLADARLPAVVHADVHGVTAQLALVSDHTDLMTARQTGAVILVSSSAQGAHDLAIVAHAAAIRLSRPVVHAIDGPLVFNTEARLQALPAEELARFVGSAELAAHRRGEPAPAAALTPEQTVQQLTLLLNTLSPRYRPFEYTGSPRAELVVVAMGAIASSLEQSLAAITVGRPDEALVGVVRVRLLRPWSPAALLAVLPPTVQRVVVFDQGTHHGPGPLYLDVLASLRTAQAHLKPGQRLQPRVLSQQLALAAYLTTDVLQNLLGLPLTASSATPRPFEAVFWNATEAASSLAQLASTASIGAKPVHVQLQTLADASHHSGLVSAAHLRIGQPVNGTQVFSPVPVTRAAVAVVDAPAAVLARFDAAASLDAGGVLLVNTAQTPEQLVAALPAAVVRSLRAANARVLVIDAAAAAQRIFGSPASARLVLALAALQAVPGHTALAQAVVGTSTPDTLAAIAAAALPVALPAELMDTDGSAALIVEPVLSAVPVAVHVARANAAGPLAQPALDLALPIVFPEAYGAQRTLRPDLRERTFQATVTVNKRLTATSYDRNVFHMEFDIAGTGLKYDIGEALGVYGHNDEAEVRAFLKQYQLDANALVSLPRDVKKPAEAARQVRTVLQLFTQVLDIFGRPSRTFYKALMEKATDVGEKSKLEHLLSSAGQDEFKARVAETVTFADMLLEFPLTPLSLSELVELVPPIKPRHYSIASSQRMHPTEVHLLVVAVDWVTPKGRKRFGQCTRYLVGLQPGAKVTVSVKPSVMKLPPLDSSPVVMAGLGTGMAPFRAFIQERAVRKREGKAVGPMVLYFGSRHRSEEYLYGEELEAYHQDGVLTHLRLAFSRDQHEKVYIQHHIAADGAVLWDYLQQQTGGAFYLCGPTWPCGDVRDALVAGFGRYGGLSVAEAGAAIERLKDEERYVLEVY